MVDSSMWNESTDVLAAVSDSKLLVWNCPNAAFVDRDLVTLTRTTTDARYAYTIHIISYHHIIHHYVLVTHILCGDMINNIMTIVILVRTPNLLVLVKHAVPFVVLMG